MFLRIQVVFKVFSGALDRVFMVCNLWSFGKDPFAPSFPRRSSGCDRSAFEHVDFFDTRYIAERGKWSVLGIGDASRANLQARADKSPLAMADFTNLSWVITPVVELLGYLIVFSTLRKVFVVAFRVFRVVFMVFGATCGPAAEDRANAGVQSDFAARRRS